MRDDATITLGGVGRSFSAANRFAVPAVLAA
jgi:hypothetical protein